MSRREVIRARVEDLHPDPEQVRRTFCEESLLSLGETLREKQIHPVIAYRKEGRLTLLDGERRWRAARLAGLGELDVIVVEEPLGNGSRVWQQAVAGIQHEQLAPCEKAQAIKRLMEDTGVTAAEAAQRFGMSPASASRLLVLLELPQDVQAAVNTGQVPASTAYEIAGVKDARTRQQLVEGVTSGSLTRADVVRRKAQGRDQVAELKTGRVSRATAMLGGRRQVTFAAATDLTLEAVIEMAEELVSKARKYRNRGATLETLVAQLKLDAKSGRPAGEGQS